MTKGSASVSGTSSESFEAAAADALAQLPLDGTQLKSARVVEQQVTQGGVVPGVEYHVTIVTTSLPPKV
jgi:flavin-binding protein dodecin